MTKPRGPRKGVRCKWDKKDYPKALDKITESMTKENFFEFCAVDQIAQALKIHRNTVGEWRTTHPEFEDAMERWEQRRNGLFYEFMDPTRSKKLLPGEWIFIAKNWLGLKDQQFIESRVTEDIKFVSRFPILHSGKGTKKKEKKKGK